MKILLYTFYAIFGVVVTIASYISVLIAAFFIDANGNLKYMRRWLQTSDQPATGDPTFWPQQHPTYSRYWLAVTWLWRNPSQGLDQLLRAKVTMQTPCTVRGNINIGDTVGVSGYYLITGGGYFYFSYVLSIGFGRCVEGGLGWRLNNIVLGYEHPTMGQLVFTPCRVQRFS